MDACEYEDICMNDGGQLKQKLKTLEQNLRDIPTNMRLFSQSIRALYSDEAVGGKMEASKKFRKLRDDTQNDAMVYIKGVLPVSQKFVASISVYFEYYESLEYDDWCEMLPDILQEATGYKQLAQTILTMHEHILVPLKKRENEANEIVSNFDGLQKEFDQKIKEFERTAERKRRWAHLLSFVPGFSKYAYSLLVASADSNLADAIANKEEALIHEKAAITVSETLIPALKNFMNNFEVAAGFFADIEQELVKFKENTKKSIEEKKKLHYSVMNREASQIDVLCKSFVAVIPAIRTDFEAIPSEGTDKSYVDKWLEEQKQIIRNKVSQQTLADSIMKAITEK